MVAVSGGLIFLGYQLLTYGWSQVQGSNAGFFDILWPGRFQGAHPDAVQNGTSLLGGGTIGALVTNQSSGNIGTLPSNVSQIGQGTSALGPGTFRTKQQNQAVANGQG